MKRATITVGQGVNKNQKPLEGVDSKRVVAMEQAATQFGGYTVVNGWGGWMQSPTELVQEPVMVITIMGEFTTEVMKQYAEFLRDLFNQESVLLNMEWVEFSEFV